MQYLVSFLVLQSSRGKRDLVDVRWLLVFCLSSSWCHGLVCIPWLWQFLVILAHSLLKACNTLSAAPVISSLSQHSVVVAVPGHTRSLSARSM